MTPNPTIVVIRSYERFGIDFGSAQWTYWSTEAEALEVLAGCRREGRVYRETFEVEFPKDGPLHRLAKINGRAPIAEREEVRP